MGNSGEEADEGSWERGLVKGNQKFCCKHVKFEAPIQRSSTDTRQVLVHTFCDLREELWRAENLEYHQHKDGFKARA